MARIADIPTHLYFSSEPGGCEAGIVVLQDRGEEAPRDTLRLCAPRHAASSGASSIASGSSVSTLRTRGSR